MSRRLDQDREALLQPKRIIETTEVLESLGYSVDRVGEVQLNINLGDGHVVRFFPYSGWHTGDCIVDGRGFKKLLAQLNELSNE